MRMRSTASPEHEHGRAALTERSYQEDLQLLFWSSSFTRDLPAADGQQTEIDIDKNTYLASFFGITKEWFQDGILQVKLSQGAVQYL